MRNLDFASNNRIEFIRSIDAPSAAKQFLIDCAAVALVLAIAAAFICARS